MLILIVGATGNMGQLLVQSALDRNHRVRALGRTPSKLAPGLRAQLESFVPSTSYYDIAALDAACAGGVDAVVCAYQGSPELLLDGQLLLLRALERAGIRIFVPASWSGDWTKIAFGQQETYDPSIALRNHIALTSALNPSWVFTGGFAEVILAKPGHGDFSPAQGGCWDPKARTMDVWGEGAERWQLTTERDAAEFTIEIVQRPGADQGGFWNVFSFEPTLREIAAAYAEARAVEVEIRQRGSVEELRRRALAERAKRPRRRFGEYIAWFYLLHQVDQSWALDRDDTPLLEGARKTSLQEFFAQNPDI